MEIPNNVFTQKLNKDKLTEAEDEIFWKKVREAYNLVATDNNKSVEFTSFRRSVICRIAKDNSGKIVIHVGEAPPDRVTLIVPPNQGDSD